MLIWCLMNIYYYYQYYYQDSPPQKKQQLLDSSVLIGHISQYICQYVYLMVVNICISKKWSTTLTFTPKIYNMTNMFFFFKITFSIIKWHLLLLIADPALPPFSLRCLHFRWWHLAGEALIEIRLLGRNRAASTHMQVNFTECIQVLS